MKVFYNKGSLFKILSGLLILLFLLTAFLLYNWQHQQKSINTDLFSENVISVIEKKDSMSHRLDLREDDKVSITINPDAIDKSFRDNVYVIAKRVSGEKPGHTTLEQYDKSPQPLNYKAFIFLKNSSQMELQLETGSYQIFCIAMDKEMSNLQKVPIGQITIDRWLTDTDAASGEDSFLIPCE